MQMLVQDIIYQLHRSYYKSVLFNDVDLFFQYVSDLQVAAIENVNLIFSEPQELSRRIHERKLAHRLSLFMFYYGAQHLSAASQLYFQEPLRAVVITQPRSTA